MTGLGGLAIGGVGALPGIGFLSVDGEQVEGGGAVFGGWVGVAAIKTAQRPLMDVSALSWLYASAAHLTPGYYRRVDRRVSGWVRACR